MHIELLSMLLFLLDRYFATRVNDTINEVGTNDRLLMRVLNTIDEIGMPTIKQYYKQLYGNEKIILEIIEN